MSAEVSLGWNNSKLQAGAKGAAAIVDAAASRMSKALNGIGAGLSAGVGLGLFNTLKNGAYSAATGIFEATVSADSLRLGMETLTGSMEAANERLAELRQLAKEPGLGFEQAVEGDIRLQSVGLSAELSTRAIREMGNALAAVGKGKADMDGVLLAFTQIASKGKISAEEINQIAERVPQVRAVMQDVFGTADTEALQKMGISADEFIRRLIEGFEKKVPRAITGLQGKLDNFTDALTSSFAAVGTGIAEQVIGPIESLTGYLEDNRQKFEEIGASAGLFLEDFARQGPAVSGFMQDAAGALEVFIQGLTGEYQARKELEARYDAILPKMADEIRLQNEAAEASRAWGMAKKSNAAITAEWTKEQDKANEATERSTVANREAAAAQAERLSGLQNQLEAAQYEALKEKLILLEQQAFIEDDILKKIRQQIDAVQGQKGGEEKTLQLRIEEQKALTEIERLKSAIEAADSKSGKATTKDTSRQAEIDQALEMYNLELAILDAKAAGHDKQAARLEREKAIIEETARIADAMSIGYDEALQKATRFVDAQQRAEARANGGDGTRSKIHGYSQSQGDATDARTRARDRVDASRGRYTDAVQQHFGTFSEMDAQQKDKFKGLFGNAPAESAPAKAAGGFDDIKSTFSEVGQNMLKLLETFQEGFK